MIRKSAYLFCILFHVLIFAQESVDKRPLFYDLMKSGISSPVINIDNSYISPPTLFTRLATINKGLDNQTELKNVEEYRKKYPKTNYLNFYGKKIEVKKDFKVESTKFRLGDKFICILKVKSENAYSLQAFFSRFNLPESSNFFLYNSEGMILGSFSNKNVFPLKESENVFVTQPIKGNEIFLELDLENEDDLRNVDIELNTIMHGFTNLYASDGPFSESNASTYTSCNKNVSCVDTNVLEGNSYNSLINKGNIKSVGLIVNTNVLYGFTCSGALMNNAKQDGSPYFLTAEHCVKGTPQQPIFLNESVVIFNHETKLCNDNGSTVNGSLSSPSTNSVTGMQVLTFMGITKYPDGTYSGLSQDFALVKLNTTAEVLRKYKVCYSGWSTLQFPNNIASSFTVHHPAGVVKKLSITNQSYITPTNFSAIYSDFSNLENPNVYFSKSFSTNLSQGYFLGVEFANGFPYHGSSGAPLFTREGFIIGTLSSGPVFEISNDTPVKPINFLNTEFKACGSVITNKAKYNVLFSRFWRDYRFMQPWLNPDSENIQSIGNYCPAGVGLWGSINIENPQQGCNPIFIKNVYATPDYLQETVKDVNQYRVKPFSTYGKKIYVKSDFIPTLSGMGINEPKISNKLLCLGIDKTCQGYYYLNHSYRVTNNAVKKIKAKDLFMTNLLNVNGEFPPVESNLINADEDRVAVIFRQRKILSSTHYNKLEVGLYKYNETDNEYNDESVIDVFQNALELQQVFPNYELDLIKYHFEGNTILILIPYAFNTKIGLIKIYRQNDTSPWEKKVFPLIYQGGFNEYFTIESKVFFKKDLLIIQSLSMGSVAFNVKSTTADPPTLLFVRKTPADILGVVNINYQENNNYELFSMKIANQINIWRFNISTLNLENYSNIYLDNNYSGFKNIYVNRNMMIVAENRALIGGTPVVDVRNKRTFYYKEGNQWVLGGSTYTSTPKISNTLIRNELIAINDSYFLDDIEWKYLQASSTGFKTQLYPAYNIINAEHLRKIFGESLSGAYMVLDNLDREEWFKGQDGVIKKYDNISQSLNSLKIITTETHDGVGAPIANGVIRLNYNNPKSYILSHLTTPLTANKSVKLNAEHSVVIKPGFEVSSASGNELHIKVTSQEVYPESLTYDDMLHPVLSDYHNKADKKMALTKLKVEGKEASIYGDIVLGEDEIKNNEIKQLKIYPNPTKDILNIDFNGKSFKTLEVYSIDAKKIITLDISSKTAIEINLSQYPSGIYMVNLIDSNGKTYPSKIIKK
ncbi:T9SS type A sorting domain-containing protein [Chryseobacterium herbae]|uniref:T9SS type A sorting domain-containing protein n=1 Tax=Chryseobacterium herbae TaxID=2976476 RepID=A0ABT2IVF8_9FLAO|nr:T9SS type A sorting domain-containing protein [Chryseobacterium sp. pc1-10]MCT2562830.1 T9SS type A sorting domain-containing protein [Chryseobacterium sp. pc1-10]